MATAHKPVIATWSGGKDSCFATYLAMQQGFRVTHLANTISYDYQRVRFHGLPASLISQQAEAIGIPLLQAKTTPDNYAVEFADNLRKGISENTTGVVFGDIHLGDCLAWAQQICSELGMEAIEPLWHRRQEEILQAFIKAGFEAVIVSTQSGLLGEEWVGRRIDMAFLEDIKRLPHIDPCGENGEYHSFVVAGPIFKQRIEIIKSRPVLRGGYWFLDIQETRLTSKV